MRVSLAAIPLWLLFTSGCAPESPGPQPGPAPGPVVPQTAMLTLDPASVTFFGLPINSERQAVSGMAREMKTCVTLIWDYSNNGKSLTRHCDDFFPGFPYVILKPASGAACDSWDYGGNSKMVGAKGCIDFKAFGPPSQDLVDVTVNVDGDLFRGEIRASNR